MKSYSLFFMLLCSSLVFAKQGTKHHLGGGVSQYTFLGDLRDQFTNTFGFNLEYERSLSYLQEYETALGFRLEYYNPKKNDFENLHILGSPELSTLAYNGVFPIGVSLALDILYWRQTRTLFIKDTYFEDIQFGLGIGVFSKSDLKEYGHLKYRAFYHLQQWSFKAPFLSFAIQYFYDF